MFLEKILRDILVGVASRQDERGSNSGRGKQTFLFKTSKPAQRPTHSLVEWLPGFFHGGKADGEVNLTTRLQLVLTSL